MMRERIKRYTDVQPVVMEGFPDAHNVFLQVTNQRFCVTPHGCESKEGAEWMRDMLCIALEKIVMDEMTGGAATVSTRTEPA
jgi:hypothetical protein